MPGQYQVYRELDPDMMAIFEEIFGFSAMSLVEAMQKGDPEAFVFAFQYPNKTPHPDFLWTGMKMILRESRAMAPRMKRVTGNNTRAFNLLSRSFLGYPWTMVVSDKDKDKRRGVGAMAESAVDRARKRLQRRSMQERFDQKPTDSSTTGDLRRIPEPVTNGEHAEPDKGTD